MKLAKIFVVREIVERKRNVGLDLVRAVAISFVVVAHGNDFLPKTVNRDFVLSFGGFFGVEFFFVLSGFLIGNILLKEFSEPKTIKEHHQVLTFWVRRWFRTLPTYYLLVLLNLIVFPWLSHAPQPFSPKYFLFLQNFSTPCLPFMPESWSLAIEEWFYFLFPLFLVGFLHLPAQRKKVILWATLSFISLFLALRYHVAFNTNTAWDSGIRKIVIYRLDAIAYGVLLVYFNFYHGNLLKRFAPLLLCLGAFFLSVAFAVFSYNLLVHKETSFNRFWLFPLTNMGVALLLPCIKELQIKNKIFPYIISHTSIVSYSMYLIHSSFVIPLVKCFREQTSSWFFLFGLYVGLTVILSTILYNYFEKPMTSLRDRYFA